MYDIAVRSCTAVELIIKYNLKNQTKGKTEMHIHIQTLTKQINKHK